MTITISFNVNVEHLGPSVGMLLEQVSALLKQSPMFADFSGEEVALLAGYMKVYRVQPGLVFIKEGDVGDYMMLVIDGQVDVYKEDSNHVKKMIATVGPGKTLGEMSMIDGEPRFATCVAVGVTTFAALRRENFDLILSEHSSLGAKILTKMVALLSQRLRQVSSRLVEYLQVAQTK